MVGLAVAVAVAQRLAERVALGVVAVLPIKLVVMVVLVVVAALVMAQQGVLVELLEAVALVPQAQLLALAVSVASFSISRKDINHEIRMD